MSTESPTRPANLAAIVAAHARIRPHVHETPLFTSRSLSEEAGAEIVVKCENLQKTGSFKARGAMNAVLQVSSERAPLGVVTHSSGNHAQALAWAARIRGIPAHVVMPTNAPMSKKRAVPAYGGRIIDCEPTLESRERTAAAVVQETGGTLVPPFDHAHVIAGQGTIALELMRQASDLDAVIVPVGGGGMISGIALALHELAPHVRVPGAEPLNASDAAVGKSTGVRQPAMAPTTIADGLRTSLGELTWPVVRDLVHRIYTPTEDEIIASMRIVFERLKLVIEPSAAVGVAVARSGVLRELGLRRVAIVLCGGNLDLDKLPWMT